MTIVIKYLPPKSGLLVKKLSCVAVIKSARGSICIDTVGEKPCIVSSYMLLIPCIVPFKIALYSRSLLSAVLCSADLDSAVFKKYPRFA